MHKYQLKKIKHFKYNKSKAIACAIASCIFLVISFIYLLTKKEIGNFFSYLFLKSTIKFEEVFWFLFFDICFLLTIFFTLTEAAIQITVNQIENTITIYYYYYLRRNKKKVYPLDDVIGIDIDEEILDINGYPSKIRKYCIKFKDGKKISSGDYMDLFHFLLCLLRRRDQDENNHKDTSKK